MAIDLKVREEIQREFCWKHNEGRQEAKVGE